MKFISKSANLHIIISPGLQAQPLTGTPAKPTISVRFKDGIADVVQEELIEKMLIHPGFNRDFIMADEKGTDPYVSYREEGEPTHVVTEMKYGHPVSRSASPIKKVLSPELKKLIQEQSIALAKQILPGMVAEALKEVVAKSKGEAPKDLIGEFKEESGLNVLSDEKKEKEDVVSVISQSVVEGGDDKDTLEKSTVTTTTENVKVETLPLTVDQSKKKPGRPPKQR